MRKKLMIFQFKRLYWQKKFFAGILSVIVFSSCTSIGQRIANGLSRFGDYKAKRDIAYGEKDYQKLDIYTPENSSQKPVVVFFYGGNWKSGSKEGYLFLAEGLTSKGFTVVIPDYGKYPPHVFPEFVEDGAAAVMWVRRNIQNYGGDPDRIFLMGHSAGSHIAALLTLDKSYLRKAGGDKDLVKGFVSLAGPFDFKLNEKYLLDIFGGVDYAKTQPIEFVQGDEPPIALFHGKKDKTVGIYNSINLAKKIRDLDGEVFTRYYEEMDHVDIVAAFARPLRSGKSVLDDVARFIHQKDKQEKASNQG